MRFVGIILEVIFNIFFILIIPWVICHCCLVVIFFFLFHIIASGNSIQNHNFSSVKSLLLLLKSEKSSSITKFLNYSICYLHAFANQKELMLFFFLPVSNYTFQSYDLCLFSFQFLKLWTIKTSLIINTKNYL